MRGGEFFGVARRVSRLRIEHLDLSALLGAHLHTESRAVVVLQILRSLALLTLSRACRVLASLFIRTRRTVLARF
jgi:hypothetical protein